MNIKEVSKEIHNNAIDKGFWDGPRNTGELLMLCVSELAEALEAHRKSKKADRSGFIEREDQILKSYINHTNQLEVSDFKRIFEHKIKDTFEDEIADTVIRLFDLAEGYDIDLEWHIKKKMEYNDTRERLHGKAY